MYKCPNCGGEIEFLPSNGKIKCQYCDSVFSPEESDSLQKTRENAQENDCGEEGIIYTCSQCGASLYTAEDTGVTFCSFCGSQAFLKRRVNGKDDIEPDLIIPFKITKERCLEIYNKKIAKAWFLPGSMKADKAVEKFRGIYMPCWIYSSEINASATFKGWDIKTVGGEDIHTDYRVNMTCNGKWDGFVYDATSSFPDGIMYEISPYDLRDARPFDAKYMAGFYADIGNVPSDAFNNEVKGKVDADFKSSLEKTNEMKKYHVFSYQIAEKTKIDSEIITAKKGYIPVWFLANKNDRTGKMSYAVINGVNGKIHTDLPIDMKKFFLVALAAAIAAFLILQFFTIKPDIILVMVMILLGFLMSLSTKMLTEAFIHEHALDDIGASYVDDDPVRKRINEKQKNENGKSTVVKGAKKGKAFTVIIAVLCFMILPSLLTAIGTVFDNRNISSYGFIIGIIVFIIIKCGFKKSKTAGAGSFVYKRNIRLPFGVTMKALLRPLIGVAVGIGILLLAPARDIFYYGGVIVCCLMLILTVLDFVRKTNELSLRKPAQLGKRGGDEDEE